LRRKVDGGEPVPLLHTRRNLGVLLAPQSDAERDDAESRARGDPGA